MSTSWNSTLFGIDLPRRARRSQQRSEPPVQEKSDATTNFNGGALDHGVSGWPSKASSPLQDEEEYPAPHTTPDPDARAKLAPTLPRPSPSESGSVPPSSPTAADGASERDAAPGAWQGGMSANKQAAPGRSAKLSRAGSPPPSSREVSWSSALYNATTSAKKLNQSSTGFFRWPPPLPSFVAGEESSDESRPGSRAESRPSTAGSGGSRPSSTRRERSQLSSMDTTAQKLGSILMDRIDEQEKPLFADWENPNRLSRPSNQKAVSKSQRRRAKKEPVVLEFANWEWAPTEAELLASMEPILVPGDKWDLNDFLDDTLFARRSEDGAGRAGAGQGRGRGRGRRERRQSVKAVMEERQEMLRVQNQSVFDDAPAWSCGQSATTLLKAHNKEQKQESLMAAKHIQDTFFSAKKLTFHGNSDLVTREPVGLLVLDDLWPSHQKLQDGKVPDRERRPTILSDAHAVHVPQVKWITNQRLTRLRSMSTSKRLLVRGFDPSYTDLHHAAAAGDVLTITQLLDGGATVGVTAADGSTPLHLAAEEGHVKAVARLVFLGADVGVADQDLCTPMHRAAYCGQASAVARLVQLGADIEAKDITGSTPLHRACQRGHAATVKTLVNLRANKRSTAIDGSTPFHHAASQGHVEALEQLIKLGADPHVVDSDGASAMHYAADQGNLEVLEVLHTTGCSVMSAATDGSRPLHWAAAKGQVEACRKLVLLGCPVNVEAGDGSSALHRAAYEGHVRALAALVELGADVSQRADSGSTPLHWATYMGHMGAVEKLLELGANPFHKTKVGLTPLHMASMNGHAAAVGLLLKSGEMEVDVKDNEGFTPLQWAAKNGKVEVITKLVQHGADVNASNRDGRISLHQAALMGHTRAVTRLVEMGSDMDRADRAGYTPLHQAAYMGHAEVVTEMSDMGCSVFVRDKSGATPLHWGAARGHLAAVNMLVARNADVNAAASNGTTPLHWAAARNQFDIVRLLLLEGANSAQRAGDGRTALHWACSNGHLEVVKLMVEMGVDVNVRASNGATPLHFAAHNGNIALIRELAAIGANPNQQESMNGATPMHWAAIAGHTFAVHVLSQLKGSLNARAYDDSTPLHWAASSGQLECTVKLCELGANILAVCDQDRTALRWAAMNGHVEVLSKLVDLARNQASGGKKEGWGSIFRKALEGTTNRVEKKKKKKKDPWAVSLEADMRRAAREGNAGGGLRGQPAIASKKVSKKIPAFLSRLYPGSLKPKDAGEKSGEESGVEGAVADGAATDRSGLTVGEERATGLPRVLGASSLNQNTSMVEGSSNSTHSKDGVLGHGVAQGTATGRHVSPLQPVHLRTRNLQRQELISRSKERLLTPLDTTEQVQPISTPSGPGSSAESFPLGPSKFVPLSPQRGMMQGSLRPTSPPNSMAGTRTPSGRIRTPSGRLRAQGSLAARNQPLASLNGGGVQVTGRSLSPAPSSPGSSPRPFS